MSVLGSLRGPGHANGGHPASGAKSSSSVSPGQSFDELLQKKMSSAGPPPAHAGPPDVHISREFRTDSPEPSGSRELKVESREPTGSPGLSTVAPRPSTVGSPLSTVVPRPSTVAPRLSTLDSRLSTAAPHDVVAHLNALDPSLGRAYETVMRYLEEINPRAAQMLDSLMSHALQHVHPGERGVSRCQCGHHLGDSAHGVSGPKRSQTPTWTDEMAGRLQGVRPLFGSPTRLRNVQFAFRATVTDIQVRMEDGSRISAREVRAAFVAQMERRLGMFDPLVLDLNGNGRFDVTTPEEGHDFDGAATGHKVRAATAAAGDAFLVLDRNGNGQIDDGGELFGDQHGAGDGFAELARFDDNHDGWIDAQDPVFSRLETFADADRDGSTDAGELRALADAHIARIGLTSRASNETANGNRVAAVGSYFHDDGSEGRAGDLMLNYLG